MIIDSAAYTNKGGRTINEDSLLCGGDIFAVADGLGGHGNGDKASACAIDYLSDNRKSAYSSDEISKLLQGANDAVCKLNELNGNGSRTTIAAAFIDNDTLHYANVGDSRLYYFRDGKVFACTKDHSVCQASVEMGLIRPEDIRNSPDRSRLLKVLGNEENLNLKKSYPPVEMQNGDAFLICSDGFWEYILESEMEADLLKSDSAEKWQRFLLRRHLLKAHNEGDNYTLVCGLIFSVDGTANTQPKKNKLTVPIIAASSVVVLAGAAIALAALSGDFGNESEIPIETTEQSDSALPVIASETTTPAEEITVAPPETTTTTEAVTTTAATTTATEAATTTTKATTTEAVTTTTTAATTTTEATETVPETTDAPVEQTTSAAVEDDSTPETTTTTKHPPVGTDYDVI